MKLAFIGIGNVGFALANNLQQEGHEIIIAHNNTKSDSVVKAQSKNPKFKALPIQDSIDVADIVFLATPFKHNEGIIKTTRF